MWVLCVADPVFMCSKEHNTEQGQQKGKSYRVRMEAVNMAWLSHTGNPEFLSEHSL